MHLSFTPRVIYVSWVSGRIAVLLRKALTVKILKIKNKVICSRIDYHIFSDQEGQNKAYYKFVLQSCDCISAHSFWSISDLYSVKYAIVICPLHIFYDSVVYTNINWDHFASGKFVAYVENWKNEERDSKRKTCNGKRQKEKKISKMFWCW